MLAEEASEEAASERRRRPARLMNEEEGMLGLGEDFASAAAETGRQPPKTPTVQTQRSMFSRKNNGGSPSPIPRRPGAEAKQRARAEKKADDSMDSDRWEDIEKQDEEASRPGEELAPSRRLFTRPMRPDLDIGLGSQEDEES